MPNHTSFVVVMHIYIIIFIALGNNDSFNIFPPHSLNTIS